MYPFKLFHIVELEWQDCGRHRQSTPTEEEEEVCRSDDLVSKSCKVHPTNVDLKRTAPGNQE
jgi:hypothetical protein